MIDFKGKPYYLDENAISWVETTLSELSIHDKVGQLFCEVVWGEEQSNVDRIFKRIKPGGVMFRSLAAEKVHMLSNYCQECSDIPMLIAANLERGGNGAVEEGTYFASPMGCAATDDDVSAYHLGYVSCCEGAAVGINWSFEPILDIDYNFNSPITNTRTFGSNPDRILRMAKAYMKGAYDAGCAVSIKHWPGDGMDFRDQHLVTSINTKSVDEWESTYGKIYRGMIDAGANSLMAAHIKLPLYSKRLNPDLKDEDILPASLSKEITTTLLRDKMDFNGVVVTDASQMVGFTACMSREKAVPASIAAGCDMFLFTINYDEDIDYMLQGVENGTISQERLDEAVTRILALKASLKLHEKKATGGFTPSLANAMDTINCKQHNEWAKECADKAITLVKNNENLLPIAPQKYKRILFRVLTNAALEDNYYDDDVRQFRNLMEKNGFEIIDYTPDCMPGGIINEVAVRDIKDKFDLVLYYANFRVASNQKDIRIHWSSFLGGDCPKFVKDIPSMFISLSNPYHLVDVPMISTYINAYSPCKAVVEALVDKLIGNSPFKGINPVDPYCQMWDTRL